MFSGNLETLHETFEVSGSRCHPRDAVTTQRWQWENIENFHRSTEMFTETPKIFTETPKIFTEFFTKNPTIGNTENSQKGKCLKFFSTSPSKPYFAGRRRLPAPAARHDDILLPTRRPGRAWPGPSVDRSRGQRPAGHPSTVTALGSGPRFDPAGGRDRDAATVAGP